MKSAKKQMTDKITSAYLGNEEDPSNQKILQTKKVLKYSPNIEYFTNSSTESLVAIVRAGGKSGILYKITDLKLIEILEAYTEGIEGVILYYKVHIF